MKENHRNHPGIPIRRRLTVAGFAAASIVALVAVAVPAILWGIAMPIRDLPQPTGPFPVGSLSYDLVDLWRHDPYQVPGSSAPEYRTIRLQLWYPAEDLYADVSAQPWMADGPQHTRAVVRSHGFPFFVWEHTRWMSSNTILNATPGGPSSYPVAIIVHGWQGYRGLHADVAEELASHGFLVAAADHSYGAAATRLSDGTILRSREEVLPSRESSDRFAEHALKLVETFSQDIDLIKTHLGDLDRPGNPTADTADTAARTGPDTGHPGRQLLAALAGRINPDRLALVGHSTGGGAALHHTLERGGVSALVGLDAWVEPLGAARLGEAQLTVPTLFLRSEEWAGGINDGYLVPLVERLQTQGAPVELHQIDGITHEQFSTLYMYSPAVQWLGLLDERDPWDFAQMQRATVREFLQDSMR